MCGWYTEAIHTSDLGDPERVRGGSYGSRAWERDEAEDLGNAQFVVEAVSCLSWNARCSSSWPHTPEYPPASAS